MAFSSSQSPLTVVRRKLCPRLVFIRVDLFYLKKSRDILRESSELINQTVEDYLQGDDFDWADLKGKVRDT